MKHMLKEKIWQHKKTNLINEFENISTVDKWTNKKANTQIK